MASKIESYNSSHLFFPSFLCQISLPNFTIQINSAKPTVPTILCHTKQPHTNKQAQTNSAQNKPFNKNQKGKNKNKQL